MRTSKVPRATIKPSGRDDSFPSSSVDSGDLQVRLVYCTRINPRSKCGKPQAHKHTGVYCVEE